MFTLMAAPQVTVPLWGFWLDHSKRPQLFIVMAALNVVIANIILGPFPGIPS